jgi:tape measure domain-containing protein
LEEFSSGTPFQFEEVANAGKLLLAFGFQADELKDRLREIGDVAAATGQELGSIATIYGQVTAAGKLTGERLNQLQERSINIAPAIAKVFGVAEKQVRDLVSKGVVSAEKFQEAFASLSSEGGIAFGGLQKKSETLNGKLSTLSDNWDGLVRIIGNKFLPVAKSAVGAINSLVKGARDLFRDETAKERTAALTKEIKELEKQLQKFDGAENANKIILQTGGSYKQMADAIKVSIEAKKKLLEISKKESEVSGGGKDDKGPTEAELRAKNLKEFNQLALEDEADFQADMAAMKDLNTEEQLLKLQENEEIKKQLDIENKAAELAAAGEHDKALAMLDDARFKRMKKAKAQEVALNRATAKANVDIATNAAALLTAILGQENKFAFFATKAASIAQAIVSTQLAMAKALAVDPTGTLSTRVGIAGGLNVATIAATTLQGFEDGGVIGAPSGGAIGATRGGDNMLATVRSGEMILNASQQAELFEAIQTGNLGSSENGSLEIVLTMNDNLVNFIEAEVIERRATGVSQL